MPNELYYPTRNSTNIAYLREENDGYFSIKSISRGDVGTHLLNRTAKEILDLCDGRIEINQLYLRLAKTNADVGLQRIKSDVDMTLKNLTALEVIAWKDDKTPFTPSAGTALRDVGQGLGMRMCDNADLQLIAEHLKSLGIPCRRSQLPEAMPGSFYLSPYCSPMEYGAVSIRMRMFQFYESLWLLCKGPILVGLAGFRSPNVGLDIEETSVASLGFLHLHPDVPESSAARFLAQASSESATWLISKTTTKVRAVLHGGSRLCSANIEGLLTASCYGLEAALERETPTGGSARYYAFHRMASRP